MCVSDSLFYITVNYAAVLEAAQFVHGLLTYALVEKGPRKGEADSRAARECRLVVRERFGYAAERVPRMRLEQLKQKRGLKVVTNVPTANAPYARGDVRRRHGFYRRELEARSSSQSLNSAADPKAGPAS